MSRIRPLINHPELSLLPLFPKTIKTQPFPAQPIPKEQSSVPQGNRVVHVLCDDVLEKMNYIGRHHASMYEARSFLFPFQPRPGQSQRLASKRRAFVADKQSTLTVLSK